MNKKANLTNDKNLNNQKTNDMKAIETIETPETIEVIETPKTNMEILNDIKKSDFDIMSIEDKTKIFETLHAFNKENEQKIQDYKTKLKDLKESMDFYKIAIKSKLSTSKKFADKFGKIERLTKQDFVLWSYLQGYNNPSLVISKSMVIWDFSAKATWTTINAFGGANDTNKKFLELVSLFSMDIAQTKQGMKVYKIDINKQSPEVQKSLLKLQNITIQDFEHESSIQKARVESLKIETIKDLEVDDNLQIVEIDF